MKTTPIFVLGQYLYDVIVTDKVTLYLPVQHIHITFHFGNAQNYQTAGILISGFIDYFNIKYKNNFNAYILRIRNEPII